MSILFKNRTWLNLREAKRYAEALTGAVIDELDFINSVIDSGANLNFNPGQRALYVFDRLDLEDQGYPIKRYISWAQWRDGSKCLPASDGVFYRIANAPYPDLLKPNTPVEKNTVAWFNVVLSAADKDNIFTNPFESSGIPLYIESGDSYDGDPGIEAIQWGDIFHSNLLLIGPKDIEAISSGVSPRIPPAPKTRTTTATAYSGTTHRPDKLTFLLQAFDKFWANADPEDKTTHPDGDAIQEWLKEKGFGKTLAEKAATIIRPSWAAIGRRPEK